MYFHELRYIKSKYLTAIECDTFNHAEIINLTDTWAANVNKVSALLNVKPQMLMQIISVETKHS